MLSNYTTLLAVLISLINLPIYAQKSIHDTPREIIEGMEDNLTKKIQSYRKGGAQDQFSYSEFRQVFLRHSNGEIGTQTLDDYFKKWYQFHNDLQKDYDEVFVLRHAFIVKQANKDLDKFLKNLGPQARKYKEDVKRVKEAYNDWLPLARSMGGYGDEAANQRRRHDSFYNFIRSLLKLYKKFPDYEGAFYQTYNREQFEQGKHKPPLVKTVFTAPPWYLVHTPGFTGAFIAALFDVVIKNKRGTFFVPLLRKADYMLKTASRAFGLHLSIRNRDLLPKFSHANDKEIFLVLPNHQIGLLDSFLLAELKLPSYLIFSDPLAFAPNKFFAKNLANHPQFISVRIKAKGNKGSMDQLKFALDTKQSKVVVNFPQGQLEPSHVQAINGNFSKNMLLSLINDGYKINLLPMIWHVPSTFPQSALKLPKGFPLNSFEGEVIPKLEPEVLQFLVNKEFDSRGVVNQHYHSLFSIFIRSIWIEYKTEYSDLSLAEMLERMNAMIPN